MRAIALVRRAAKYTTTPSRSLRVLVKLAGQRAGGLRGFAKVRNAERMTRVGKVRLGSRIRQVKLKRAAKFAAGGTVAIAAINQLEGRYLRRKRR